MASAAVLFTSLFSMRAEQMILRGTLLLYNITHRYTKGVSCLVANLPRTERAQVCQETHERQK